MKSTGWGGQRVGSGAKPTKDVIQAEPDSGVLAVPPGFLPAEQRDFWERYAGLAIEKRTLTVHTVAAFVELCETFAEKTATLATITKDGRTFLKVTVDGAGVEHQELKAHPLTGAYGRLARDVMAGLGKFGLAPFGKAELPMAKKVAANPWAQVAQK